MTKKILIEPLVNYDGILSQDERKKILTRIESAFSWLGATIPTKIELDGETYRLCDEIQKLIMKDELTYSENERIKRLISALEHEGKILKDVVETGKITEEEAIAYADKICGILRAVHKLRELIKKAPKSKALDAKEELMRKIEDKKRWLEFSKKIQ